MDNVTFKIVEALQARADRRFKQMWVLVLVLLFLLVGSNFGWLVYEGQFEEAVTISQDVDTETAPAYVNGTGSLTINGTNTTDNN